LSTAAREALENAALIAERKRKKTAGTTPSGLRLSTKKDKTAKLEKEAPVSLTSGVDVEDMASISSQTKSVTTPFTREDLINGIRCRRFRKVAFLTGAGISVAAGIPDFRTPKTGLYAQLKEFGLPHPEEIFSLEFLLHNPEPFYAVAHRYLQYEVQPVLAHRFIKQFADQQTLFMDYTQNIDGLELDAGIPAELLVQAHGHMRSAHCSDQKCRAEADMKEYTQHIQDEKVLYCTKCSSGIVKPDIVFFGEKLPRSFHKQLNNIHKADLVFIMGTSLKVKPFSTLLTTLPQSTPLVVLNYHHPAGVNELSREKLLFLEGDIETNTAALMKECGWMLEDGSIRDIREETIALLAELQRKRDVQKQKRLEKKSMLDTTNNSSSSSSSSSSNNKDSSSCSNNNNDKKEDKKKT